MKFSPFPQMINQNEAVLLCPLPVIFRMNEGDQDSKEEVKKYPLPLLFCACVRRKL